MLNKSAQKVFTGLTPKFRGLKKVLKKLLWKSVHIEKKVIKKFSIFEQKMNTFLCHKKSSHTLFLINREMSFFDKNDVSVRSWYPKSHFGSEIVPKSLSTPLYLEQGRTEGDLEIFGFCVFLFKNVSKIDTFYQFPHPKNTRKFHPGSKKFQKMGWHSDEFKLSIWKFQYWNLR